MPTPPSPITIPTSLSYRSVVGRSIPLTNLELDGNFAYLERLAELRLLITDFTSTNIVTKLNDDPATSAAGGLDVALLRGSAPSSANASNSIVLRDAEGDFYASVIYATTFSGKATDAASADGADKLNTARTINGVSFNGTQNITIADSTKVVKAGDTMTGKLTLLTPTTASASLTLPHGVAPTTLVNGDIWTTTSGQFNRIAGISRRVAYIDSDISGTASNVTGIVSITNGGTGANDAAEAREKLSAATRGNNTDITRLSGLTTAISAAQGGTGLTSPGAAGNVLTSNGNGTWASKEPSFIPSGAVIAFAMASAPAGWLECNGDAVSRSTYAELFAAIGVTYGVGNGTTTFNLPDLRAEFIRGWDHSRGIDSGRTIGSKQKGTLHLTDPNYGSFNVCSPIGRYNYAGGSTGVVGTEFPSEVGSDYIASGVGTYPNVMLTSVPGATPVEIGTGGFSYGATRPRNVAMMYCIKI